MTQDKAKENWRKAKEKIKEVARAFPIKDGKFDPDCAYVRINLDQEPYLAEVATAVFEGHAISTQDKEELVYKDHSLTLRDGTIVDTRIRCSRAHSELQPFVMSKEGILYLFEKDKGSMHGAVLNEVPVEMAGSIGINAQGKIYAVHNQSGHYGPNDLDIYRGVKKLLSTMPDVFDPICRIYIDYSKIPDIKYSRGGFFVADFLKIMETVGRDGLSHHERMRNNRIALHEEQNTIIDEAVAKSKKAVASAALGAAADKKWVERFEKPEDSPSAGGRGSP